MLTGIERYAPATCYCASAIALHAINGQHTYFN
jgi:hypothetical protein